MEDGNDHNKHSIKPQRVLERCPGSDDLGPTEIEAVRKWEITTLPCPVCGMVVPIYMTMQYSTPRPLGKKIEMHLIYSIGEHFVPDNLFYYIWVFLKENGHEQRIQRAALWAALW